MNARSTDIFILLLEPKANTVKLLLDLMYSRSVKIARDQISCVVTLANYLEIEVEFAPIVNDPEEEWREIFRTKSLEEIPQSSPKNSKKQLDLSQSESNVQFPKPKKSVTFETPSKIPLRRNAIDEDPRPEPRLLQLQTVEMPKEMSKSPSRSSGSSKIPQRRDQDSRPEVVAKKPAENPKKNDPQVAKVAPRHVAAPRQPKPQPMRRTSVRLQSRDSNVTTTRGTSIIIARRASYVPK